MVENALTIGIIKMALPDPNYVASVPLQYVFLDKDTGASLAAGIVSFFSDPEFSIPKDVYQLTNNPDNTITFTNLGNVLVLSGIGTFVDGSGENLVPYYYPWENPPGDEDGPGDEQLYFVKVESSGLILQFTLTEWPPNSLSGSGGTSSGDSLTQNLLSNPGFSVISFTATPGGNTYQYTVASSSSFPVAPGWSIDAVGSGAITVEQLSLSSSIPSNAPYALAVSWSTGFTQLRVNQTLTNSPRLLQGDTVSGSIVASSLASVSLQLLYIPSNGLGSPVQLVVDSTPTDQTYATIAGNATITSVNTDSAAGYVIFSIEIDSLTTGNTLKITSAQMVEVAANSGVAAYIQQSTQEELNGLMWYYEPKVAAKPIPYYTIGWDFPFNPGQILGQSGGAVATGANTSSYILDQTILFQTVTSAFTWANSIDSGLTITAAASSSFALIQYLDATAARELLIDRMAVQLRGYCSGGATALNGQVNLYWASSGTVVPVIAPIYPIPSPPAPSNLSLVTSITAGAPTVATGWNLVPRSNLGPAAFTLTNSSSLRGGDLFGFSGWDATGVTGTDTPAFFAIVISFDTLTIAQAATIDYCTLVKGDIATAPGALNEVQTLKALQYYYESSFAYGVVPGALSSNNPGFVTQRIAYTGSNVVAAPFTLQYQSPKRSSTSAVTSANEPYMINFYAPSTGAINSIYAQLFTGATINVAGTKVFSDYFVLSSLNTTSSYWVPLNTSSILASGAGGSSSIPIMQFNYTIDARFGVVA